MQKQDKFCLYIAWMYGGYGPWQERCPGLALNHILVRELLMLYKELLQLWVWHCCAVYEEMNTCRDLLEYV